MKKAIRILLAVLLVSVIVVTFAACSEQDPCQANGHKWDEGTYTLAPTCKDVGKAIFRCKVCGEEEEREVPKTEEHKWDDGVITTEPTCATHGVRTYTCSVCQTTKTEKVDPTGKHTKGEAVAQVDATCHSKGTKAYWLCEDCGAKLNEAGVVVTDADLEIDMLAHVWDNGTITKDPTCTETGTKLFKCTNPGCIETFEQTLETTDHVFGRKVEKVDPTCTTDGHLAYYQCEECEQYFDENKAPAEWDDLFQEKLGHQERTLEKVDPTCQNTGLTEGTVCDRCGETLKAQQPLDKLPHTPVPYGDKAATCEAKGYQGGQECSVCHTILVQPKEVPATGHAYVIDETKGDKGWLWSDDFGEASLYLKCNNANCPKPDVSVKADVSSNKPDADHTEYTAVARYDDQVYRTTLTVNKNHENHEYVVVQWNWDGYQCESVTLRCTVGNEQITVAATVEVEHTVVPDCTQGGKNTYTATAEHEGVTYTDSKVEELEPTAHQPKADLEHDDNGHGHKCEVCGDYVDYTEHTFKDEHNTTHHWEECTEPECGYKKNEVEHSLGEYEHSGTTHWQKCEGCEYTTTPVAHNIKYTTNVENRKHSGSCVCGFTVAESDCTLQGGKCTVCKQAYTDKVTIHLHLPDGWSKAYLWAWTTENGDLFSGVTDPKREMKPEEGLEGWVVITVDYPADVLYEFKFTAAMDWVKQTGNQSSTAKEIWCAKNGVAYDSFEGAEAADKIAGPTADDWFVTGSFSSGATYVLDWEYAFGKMDGEDHYTVTIAFKSGDWFKIKQNDINGTDEFWKNCITYADSTKWTITAAAGIQGDAKLVLSSGENNNFITRIDCTLQFTFNPTSKTVAIVVVEGEIPEEIKTEWYIVGSMTSPTWKTGDAKWKFTENEDGTFTLTNKYLATSDQFKLLSTEGTWLGAGELTFPGEKITGTDNISVIASGYYDFTFNPTRKTLNIQKHVEAHTHSYELTGWQWNKDFTQATATFTCSNPGCPEQTVTKVATGAAITVVTGKRVNPTCQTTGTEYYSATVEGPDGKSYTTTEAQYGVQTLDKLPHSYGAPVWGAWTEKDGAWTITVTFTCTTCEEGGGHVITPEVDVKRVETVATDCKKAGYVTWSASVTVEFGEHTYNAEDKVVETAPLDHAAAENAPWYQEGTSHYRLCQWCKTEHVDVGTCAPLDASKWEVGDETSHWQLCGVCNNKINTEAHGKDNLKYTTYDNEQKHDVECTKCGYSAKGVVCTPDGSETDWHHDADYHWHECTLCGSSCDKTPHEFSGQTCTKCGQEKSDITIRVAGKEDHQVGSIKEAVEYVHNHHEDGTYPSGTQVELILNADRTGDGFDMMTDSNFIINLNTHTFTIQTQSLNVVAGAKIEFKNGKIQGDDKLSKDVPMIVTSGTVTFTNVDLKRSNKDWTAVRIDGGTFTVTSDGTHKIGGTLLYNNKSAVVTITGKNLDYNGKLAEGIECTVANITVNDVRLTHDFAQPTWAWEGNETDGYTKATATFVCNLCKHTDKVEATEGKGLTHSTTKPATCEATGTETYTATVSHNDSDFTTAGSDLKTKTIPATGHTYTAKWTWKSTTIADGAEPQVTVELECDKCHDKVTDITATISVVAESKNDPDCTNTGSIKYTASVTYPAENGTTYTSEEQLFTISALGHNFEGDYKDNGDTHQRQCTRCEEYDEAVAHSYAAGSASNTWVDDPVKEQHNSFCTVCKLGEKENQPCTLNANDVCTVCQHDYRVDVTVHFLRDNTKNKTPLKAWSSSIYAYVWYNNNAGTKVEPFDEFDNITEQAEAKITLESGNWYKITFKAYRGSIGDTLGVIFKENTGIKSHNAMIDQKEVWITLDGSVFHSQEEAETYNKTLTLPGSNAYYIAGTFNGEVWWENYTNSWRNVFREENDWTLESDYKKGDTFRVRLNTGNWGGNSNFNMNSNNGGISPSKSGINTSRLITEGDAGDYNFEVQDTCTLRITFNPNDHMIYIVVLSRGTTHTHEFDESTHKAETPSTCSEHGLQEHYECTCGLFFNMDKKVVTQTALEKELDQTNHSWVLANEGKGKEPTCTEAGYKPYYVCESCGRFAANDSPRADEIFSTEAEVQKAAGVALAATGHTFVLADKETYVWSELTATSAKLTVNYACNCGIAHSVEFTLDNPVLTKDADCEKDKLVHFTHHADAEAVKAAAKDIQENDTFAGFDEQTSFDVTVEDTHLGHSYVAADTAWTWVNGHESATFHLVCSREECQAETTEHHTYDITEIHVDSASESSSCTTPSSVTYTATITEEKINETITALNSKNTFNKGETELTFSDKSSDDVIPGHNWVVKEISWEEDTTGDKTSLTVTVTLKCDREKDTENTIDVTFAIEGKVTNATCTANQFTTYMLNKSEDDVRTQAKKEHDSDGKLTLKDTFCVLSDEHVVTKNDSAKGHDFTGDYKYNENNTHVRKCVNGCGTYGGEEQCTKFDYDVKEKDREHATVCRDCKHIGNYESCSTQVVTDRDTGSQTEKCITCQHDYAEEVTVHFHRKNNWGLAWDQYLNWYAYYGSDSSEVILTANFPGIQNSSSLSTSTSSVSWVTITFKVSTGHVGKDLIIIFSDGSAVDDSRFQTPNVQVSQNEIWVAKDGFVGGSEQAVTTHESATTLPTESDYILAGTIGEENYSAAQSTSAYNAFLKSNSYTLTFKFVAGNEFKIKKNVADWDTGVYTYDNIKTMTYEDTKKSVDLNQLITKQTQGVGAGNIRVEKDCELEIKFDATVGILIHVKEATLAERTIPSNLSSLSAKAQREYPKYYLRGTFNRTDGDNDNWQGPTEVMSLGIKGSTDGNWSHTIRYKLNACQFKIGDADWKHGTGQQGAVSKLSTVSGNASDYITMADNNYNGNIIVKKTCTVVITYYPNGGNGNTGWVDIVIIA